MISTGGLSENTVNVTLSLIPLASPQKFFSDKELWIIWFSISFFNCYPVFPQVRPVCGVPCGNERHGRTACGRRRQVRRQHPQGVRLLPRHHHLLHHFNLPLRFSTFFAGTKIDAD